MTIGMDMNQELLTYTMDRTSPNFHFYIKLIKLYIYIIKVP